MKKCSAVLEIIGINPFVFLPDDILQYIFDKAGKEKSPIRVKGKVNEKPFNQNLVRYKGAWRLYINTSMLKDSPKRIGEKLEITIDYDPEKKEVPMHPGLAKALKENSKAKDVFERLPPSKQKEILKYISSLKTEESIDRNITKAINFLHGNGRFLGRDKP